MDPTGCSNGNDRSPLRHVRNRPESGDEASSSESDDDNTEARRLILPRESSPAVDLTRVKQLQYLQRVASLRLPYPRMLDEDDIPASHSISLPVVESSHRTTSNSGADVFFWS